jgi:hypothetical protein
MKRAKEFLKPESTSIEMDIKFYIYLWGLSGTKSIINAAIFWPVVPALDDRG